MADNGGPRIATLMLMSAVIRDRLLIIQAAQRLSPGLCYFRHRDSNLSDGPETPNQTCTRCLVVGRTQVKSNLFFSSRKNNTKYKSIHIKIWHSEIALRHFAHTSPTSYGGRVKKFEIWPRWFLDTSGIWCIMASKRKTLPHL